MKSVFDSSTREELIARIRSLSPQHNSLWGKMDVFQMVKHMTLSEEMMHGRLVIKRVFIGRLIGKMILKKVLKDEAPFRKNSPTSPLLSTIGESGDVEQQKKEWTQRVEEYAHYDKPGFVHPFFGPITKEQVGFFTYKHADHHLRQFGA